MWIKMIFYDGYTHCEFISHKENNFLIWWTTVNILIVASGNLEAKFIQK